MQMQNLFHHQDTKVTKKEFEFKTKKSFLLLLFLVYLVPLVVKALGVD